MTKVFLKSEYSFCSRSLVQKFWFGLGSLCLILLQATPSLASYVGKDRSYTQVQEFLARLARENPKSTSLIEIGQSDAGVSIVGVKIGSGALRTLIVGTHHGNEYGSTEVALAMAESLAHEPMAEQTVFVIPVLNISGYNADRRQETIGSSQFTTDPNRDYPGPCGTGGPFKLKSTKALAQLIDREQIVTLATLHTFGPLVLYPWGISTRDTKTSYDDLFIGLCSAVAQQNGYEVGNSTDALYPADGTFEDYAFWKHGIWSILFEIGTTHDPSEAQLAQAVAGNVPAIRTLLLNAPKQRAQDHAFHGACDVRLMSLDLKDE